MRKSYNVLVLTDHLKHSDQNSVYAIARAIVKHSRCNNIYVASRGIDLNAAFFYNLDPNQLYGTKINQDFQYTVDGRYYKKKLGHIDIEDIDLVLLRLPRPVSDQFLFWIEKIFSHSVIINRPSGIVKTSSKAFLLELPLTKKDMKLCYSIEEVIDFAALFPIVLKPLKAYGGQGILKIDGDKLDNGENIFNTTEYLLRIQEPLESEGYLAMKFLKNVHLGDKRILVVGGEIMASSLRLPPENAWLCNVAQGGQAELTTADDDEKAIIKNISPILEENGILIFGVDTLVDDDGKRILSEVNTLSIGGFMQAEEQSGLPIIKKTIDKIFNYADAQFQQCSTN